MKNEIDVSQVKEAVVTLAPIVYPVIETAIAQMAKECSGLTASTPEGYELVRIAIGQCRDARGRIEARRVELKADALAFGREVDKKAKALTSMLLEIEEPLKLLKGAVDAEKERIKLAKEAEERARIEAELNKARQAVEEAEKAEQARVAAERLAAIKAQEDKLAEEREKFEAEKRELEAARAAKKEEDDARAAVESAKLAKEKAEQDRLRVEAENEARLKREAEEARLKAVKEELDAQARRNAEIERLLAQERAEIQRARDEQIAREAAAKAEADRVALEKAQAEIRAKEAEAIKTDSAKLITLAEALGKIKLPTVQSTVATLIIDRASVLITELISDLHKAAK